MSLVIALFLVPPQVLSDTMLFFIVMMEGIFNLYGIFSNMITILLCVMSS